MGYAKADPMLVKLAAPYRPPRPRSMFLRSTLLFCMGSMGLIGLFSEFVRRSSEEPLHETLKRWVEVLENKADREDSEVMVVGTVDKLREAIVFACCWCSKLSPETQLYRDML
ncbi:hypothetical protein HanRHA438_Chr03g0125861 [Helianthus annuus]|nr:hypothetical protein HanIR_Chr03g0124531 [Helianthus annuus]KAJ0935999.1 hypothetical protein HanRHA438_Chr03g0125861 [Helianthus annuus]